MKDDDTRPEPIVRGGAEQISVFLSEDRQSMGLKFDFLRPVDGRWQAIPTEVLCNTDVGMALLMSLQEMQRMFGIPIPDGGTLSLTREKAPQD